MFFPVCFVYYYHYKGHDFIRTIKSFKKSLFVYLFVSMMIDKTVYNESYPLFRTLENVPYPKQKAQEKYKKFINL